METRSGNSARLPRRPAPRRAHIRMIASRESRHQRDVEQDLDESVMDQRPIEGPARTNQNRKSSQDRKQKDTNVNDADYYALSEPIHNRRIEL